MIEEKRTELITWIAMLLAILLTLFILIKQNTESLSESNDIPDSLGISSDYAAILFDDSYVHTIDITMTDSNYRYMIEHALEEVYMICDATIDGHTIKNVALRPKGNSSLASIAAQNSEHFSYKIEFDHYKKDHTYYGLDKLSLNNLGQDKSCLKDYFSYKFMQKIGIPSPLCSYTLLRINGKEIGLYLSVEGIEDSFSYRNYGNDYGNLYRPDVFAIDTIKPNSFTDIDLEAMFAEKENAKKGQRVDILGRIIFTAFESLKDEIDISAMGYAGDDAASYSVIFDSTVFDINEDDKKRYINAVRLLNDGMHYQDALELENVMRYFVVHNFLNNYDSYTGLFVHNFYLHEKDGRLSMVPWDYNLSFGAFSVESAMDSFFGNSSYDIKLPNGEGLSSEESFVNYPVDTPSFAVDIKDRPMFSSWINDRECKSKYYEIYGEFLDYFDSGKFEEDYTKICKEIMPYVEKDLCFYDSETVNKASLEVNKYCYLRSQSIRKQIEGSIPSTLKGQEENPDSLIKCSNLNLASTIDFTGVAFGITPQDIIDILDIVCGSYPHNEKGLEASIKDLSEDKEGLLPILFEIIKESSLPKKLLSKKLKSLALFLISMLLLLLGIKYVKKYERQ